MINIFVILLDCCEFWLIVRIWVYLGFFGWVVFLGVWSIFLFVPELFFVLELIFFFV